MREITTFASCVHLRIRLATHRKSVRAVQVICLPVRNEPQWCIKLKMTYDKFRSVLL